MPSSPELIGSSLLPALLILLGLAKCLQISRRETTSKRCVLALALALSAWLWVYVARPMVGLPSMPARILLLAPSVLAALAALPIAGFGLLTYTPAVHNQGRKQAVAAVVVSLFILGSFAIGAAIGYRKTHSVPVDMRIPMGQGDSLEYPELGFRMSAPPSPWVRVDVKRLNKAGTLAFGRANPIMYTVVIAENVPGANITSEALAEIAKANMKSAADSVEIVSDEPQRVGDREGRRLQTRSRMNGEDFSHVLHIVATGDHGFQIASWCDRKDEAALQLESAKMVERFVLTVGSAEQP